MKRIITLSISNPITQMQGKALSFDIPASFMGGVFVGARGIILGNLLTGAVQNVRVPTIVFDTSTQRIVAAYEGYLETQG